MADRVELSITLRRRIVEALLEIARAGPWWEREDAFAALSELAGDAYAAERLLALAGDTTAPAGVRRGAAEALAAIGWEADARRVLRALGRDGQVPATVRYGVAQALERLGRPKEAVTVLRALGHDEHAEPTVRRSAAEMLARMGRVKDAEALQVIPAIRRAVVRLPPARPRLADRPAEELLALARDPHQNETIRYDAYLRLKGLLGGRM
jgi:HEAT repeat protein